MDGRGNAHLVGCTDHRSADVTPGADHQVRLKLPDNLFRLGRPFQGILQRLDVFPDLPAVKAAGGDVHDIVSVRRNDFVFQRPVSPDEQDLSFRVMCPDLVRNRQGRVNMSPRAAAGQYDFQ